MNKLPTGDYPALPGPSPTKFISAATINALVLKNNPGQITEINLNNSAAALRFLKFFDQITAPNPAGGDIPKYTFALPPSNGQFIPPVPLGFAVGIAMAITVNAADNDATVIAANDVVGAITVA